MSNAERYFLWKKQCTKFYILLIIFERDLFIGATTIHKEQFYVDN